LLNAKNIIWPQTNGYFADESSSPQHASVRNTALSSCHDLECVGHIDEWH